MAIEKFRTRRSFIKIIKLITKLYSLETKYRMMSDVVFENIEEVDKADIKNSFGNGLFPMNDKLFARLAETVL